VVTAFALGMTHDFQMILQYCQGDRFLMIAACLRAQMHAERSAAVFALWQGARHVCMYSTEQLL
jgi:hypothetical protein